MGAVEEYPGGRRHQRESARPARTDAGSSKTTCRFPLQSPQRIGGPIEHRNGHTSEDLGPTVPQRQLQQVVGAHDPDEALAPPRRPQGGQRVDGTAGAQHGFDAADTDARVARGPPRARQPLGVGRHAARRLERVVRRYQPPHLVERQQVERQQADMAVSLMRGIERAAEQADAPLAANGEGGIGEPRRRPG